MTPKSKKHDRAAGDDLLAVRVLREQEWCYAGWLQHKSWAQLRIEANRLPDQGGLGYDLSIQAIKGLVDGYRARIGDLHVDREAQIERELHDLDLAQQLTLASMRKGAEVDALDVHGTGLFLKIGAERRKLLGLDQPVKVEADVTHRDAVVEELNAMLARAGRDPIDAHADEG